MLRLIGPGGEKYNYVITFSPPNIETVTETVEEDSETVTETVEEDGETVEETFSGVVMRIKIDDFEDDQLTPDTDDTLAMI